LAYVAPVAAAVLGVALVGCPTTTTTPTIFTPVTGIEIDSASLVFGFGCGTGSTQVFKYAAVVSIAPPGGGDAGIQTGISGVFDCFANATFSNLPLDAGSSDFTLQIFAFNEASFPPELACAPGEGGTQGICTNASAVLAFQQQANWTAVCTATQVGGVTVPAVCPPLEPVGTAAGLGDAGIDAAGAEAGGDAASMGDADAGAGAGG
jgi:hypothetical protein